MALKTFHSLIQSTLFKLIQKPFVLKQRWNY